MISAKFQDDAHKKVRILLGFCRRRRRIDGDLLGALLAVRPFRMRRLIACLLLSLSATSASAANGPKWTPAELAQFADVVVTGRVISTSSGWDQEVNAIYTYTTLQVREVLKGDIDDDQITIKQLGGAAGAYVLSVVDQPTFAVGEEVLLYLEARPRDGTLYTSAVWQGKWKLSRDGRGEELALRQAPEEYGGSADHQLLRVARRDAAAAERVRAWDARDDRQRVVTQIADVPQASGSFTLLGPFRYLHTPAVDIQAGGQPGLPGGGVAELQAAIQRWNNAGSAFRYVLGSTSAAPRCSGQMLGTGRITVTFMDPCGEMSNAGGTLAMGGSYYVPGEGGVANGQAFERAIEGFVINNDSPVALEYLTNRGCFEDIQTHELGHVLGLNHSADSNALMYAYIDRSCMTGARGLRADDLQGVLFIYGRGAAPQSPPLTPPTNVRVAVQTTQLQISWADPGSGATSYQLDFRAGYSDVGAILASLRSPGTSLAVSIPPGLTGPFSLTVRGVNIAGVGPPSARADFTLGDAQPGPCSSAPSAPGGISAAISNGFARVQWAAVPGAVRYLVQAGSQVGFSDLFPPSDVGGSTMVGASVPPGFRAWVRVVAVNACGTSSPTDVFLQ